MSLIEENNIKSFENVINNNNNNNNEEKMCINLNERVPGST